MFTPDLGSSKVHGPASASVAIFRPQRLVNLRRASHADDTPLQGVPLLQGWRHPKRSNCEATFVLPADWLQAIETSLVLLDDFHIRCPVNIVSTITYDTIADTQQLILDKQQQRK